jgi:hypothetical protein
VAFAGGAIIAALGGLIGLGGAEFRRPLLIGAFRFAALQAVILNKAMSLVVASALPFRAATVPFTAVAAHWPIILSLLAGSLLGAWFGAGWATRLASQTLYRVVAALLLGIAVVLALGHDAGPASGAMLTGTAQMIAGVAAGFAIGVVAALLGVAGGELLIPTLVLLFRRRHQARRQPVACCEPADHAGRFRPLQPGPQLRGAWRKPPLRADNGGRLDLRQLHRRPTARVCAERHPAAAAGGYPRAFRPKVWTRK